MRLASGPYVIGVIQQRVSVESNVACNSAVRMSWKQGTTRGSKFSTESAQGWLAGHRLDARRKQSALLCTSTSIRMAAAYLRICSSPDPDAVGFDDMVQAARKVSNVFTSASITHGFLGSFAFRLLGSACVTGDVDCCVDSRWLDIRRTLSTEAGCVVSVPVEHLRC